MGRVFRILLLSFLAGSAASGFAQATTRVAVKTEHYRISGRTGQALLDAMDRGGPKHGFLTRAIAQTRYSMKSTADWHYSKGICRARNIKVDLSITYVYPRPAARFDAALAKRWKRFMAGVVVHEEMHGKIARQMAGAAEKTVASMAVRDRPDCPTVQRLMKRRINTVVAEYEARQERFDEVEHRNGGNIDRLVGSLIR